MPLPFIIGGIAAAAGATGVGTGIHGGVKLKKANDTMKEAQDMQESAVKLFERKNKETTDLMDLIGKHELEILNSFERFSNIIEKIQGRPSFKTYSKNGVNLPEYEAEELKKVSAGAGAILGGLGGAVAGTAGGFAAAGATTSAVMALGTASTGTAISTLSGAAASNAALAALGGGATYAGGGGMALGSAVLGGATLGVGLLVGGVIFSVTGSKLSQKADEAYEQATKTKQEVNKIVNYLDDLLVTGRRFNVALLNASRRYYTHLDKIDELVNQNCLTKWSDFTQSERLIVENTALLVGLLYKMCKTQIVLKDTDGDGYNSVNKEEVAHVVDDANKVVGDLNDAA